MNKILYQEAFQNNWQSIFYPEFLLLKNTEYNCRSIKIRTVLWMATMLITIPINIGHTEELELGEVVISAGRNPIAAEQVGRAYTIISNKTLEENQVRYVADALRKVPGLAVSRTGGIGGPTQIRIRGSEANHVLVLIDGVEAATNSSGEYDFAGLQASNIERVEVIRGPQSALYGSNATSGVIHIITKAGKRDGHEITMQTELGSDKTLLGSLSFRTGGENFDVALSGIHQRTDGFNISNFGSEDDGSRNTTFNGKVNWDLTDHLKFNANFRYVNRHSDTDDQDFAFPETPTQGQVIDTLDSYGKLREFYGGAGLTWNMFDDHLTQKLRAKITDVMQRGQSNKRQNGNDNKRYHISYQSTLSFATPTFANAKHNVTGAIEWKRETFRNKFPSNPSQFPLQQRDLYGYIGEYKGEFFEHLFLSAAIRYDQNDFFEDSLTYSTSAAYLMDKTNTRFHASLGTGVTNPTFYEQFGFIPSSFIGNSQLEPEKNFGWDIGITQKLWDERLNLDVTYFNERLKDEIQTRFLPNFTSTPVNLAGTSKRQGLEVSADITPFDNLTMQASYTYLDAQEPDGQAEVRRPKHSGALNVTYRFANDRASFFADAIYNGSMEDREFINKTPRDRVKLDNYILVNIGANYQLSEDLQIYGRIENLFDEDYEEVFGYKTQGRTAFIGIKAKF